LKSDIFNHPEEHKLDCYHIPRFHFTISFGSWKLDKDGLHRWWSFKAAKPNAKGVHCERFGWKKIIKFRK